MVRNRPTDERVAELTDRLVDALEDERADDAITALLHTIGQEMTLMCPMCRLQAVKWLKVNLPNMLLGVEAYIAQHGESVAPCDGSEFVNKLHS